MSSEGTSFTISKGDVVWVPVTEDTECYKNARVKEKTPDNSQVTVFDDNYKSWSVKGEEVFPTNPKNMDGVPDNTQLMFLHDPSLLHNIRVRYERDEIYTYTAYILIAVNPYKRLKMYDDETIKQYSGSSMGRLSPHVFAIADRAFRMMKGSGKNQSIVVSGESGAGKTETCKFLMRFFAVVAGSGENLGNLDNLESKILLANPILEAFGNAKTIRNNNSSRFGKFTELHFNKRNQLAGASIVTYLLEKSRVVTQAKNERNFHIFYQMIAGASSAEHLRWKLEDPSRYYYLNQSGCTTIDNVNDKEEFELVKKSFKAIGISDDIQEQIFTTLSGILQMGNLTFEASQNVEKEDVTIVSASAQDSLAKAAELLGFDKQELESRLVYRTLVVGLKAQVDPKKGKATNSNAYRIPLTPQEAIYARDSLAKHIYSTIFDWLVKKINSSLPYENSTNFIGILDISGFEIFQNNSFEQFCINFANEKIQQYFNQQILQQEQEIYLLEGLQWRKVDYKDNQDVISLVEAKRTGVFAILDEECIVPKATDKSFCTKVHTTHSGNNYLDVPKYTKDMKVAKRLNKDEGFVINHFAGQVIYNSLGFLDKNNDTLHDDLQRLLYISKKKYINDLFPEPDDDEVSGLANRRFKSVSVRFQQQLDSLMTQLNSTTSHFIRCIKPNELQKPDIFNGSSVMQQLRYNGMCTALRLMQQGFPTRCNFEDLYERYSKLMPPVISRLKPITFCEALLVALDLHGGKDFQMGLTKVFFRAGKLQFLDDLTSNSQDTINNIAGKVKKWLAKKRWKGAIFGVISLRRLYVQALEVRKVHHFRRLTRSMVSMSKVWLPLLDSARQNILSSEEYKKKLEEEERRREGERQVERRKREEEERKKKEEEERIRREQEEAKKMLEEQRKREEEARKATEEKLKVSLTKIATLEDTIQEEQKKAQQVTVIADQLKSELERIKQDLSRVESVKHNLESKLESENKEKRVAENQLNEVQQSLDKEKQQKSEIQSNLVSLKSQYEELQNLLTSERQSHAQEIATLTMVESANKSELQQNLDKLYTEKANLQSQLSDQQLVNKQLTADKEGLQNRLDEEKSSFVKYKEDTKAALQAESKRYDELKEQMKIELSEKDSIIQRETSEKTTLRDQLNDTQNQLLEEKNTTASLARHKAAVEDQLSAETQKNEFLTKELSAQKDLNNAAEKEIAMLKNYIETLKAELAQEKKENQRLSESLESEKKAREEDNRIAKETMEKLFNQAKLDLKAKQVVIKKLEGDNTDLMKKLADLAESSKNTIQELEIRLRNLTKQHNTLEEDFKTLNVKHDQLAERSKVLEREKGKLTQTCLSLHETKRKFKALLDRYTKQEDLAKLLFGDLSFQNIVRDCTKQGLLQKQGGQHVNRWQARHIVLNENFLFYYASPNDKVPKGLTRLDGDYCVEVAKCDLHNLKKEHTFTCVVREVLGDKHTRPFFFQASTDEECEEWIKALTIVKESRTYM